MGVAHALVNFTLAAGLFTILPGLNTALVLRTAAVEGSRRAALVSVGIVLGCFVWGLAASIGLGALLAASSLTYNILRIASGICLIYMGGQLLRQAIQQRAAALEVPGSARGRRSWLLRGLLTNLLNPKVGVFYVTVLPLFIPAHVNVTAFSMLLTAIHATEGVVWFALLIIATRPLSRWLHQPGVERGLDGIAGALLICFGGALLCERWR